MTGQSELRVHCRARTNAAAPVRHALAAFLNVLEIEPETCDDILTAVGEALANAVEHAYDGATEQDAAAKKIELLAQLESGDRLSVHIFDCGRFIERAPRPGRGLGFRIVRAIAREVAVTTDGGTDVHMIFELRRRTQADQIVEAQPH